MRVFHLQTGRGSSGGIAVYISQLVRSNALGGLEHFVGASDLGNRAAMSNLYGGARVIHVPASYSLVGLVSYCQKIHDVVCDHRINVVHVHALRGALPLALMRNFLDVPYLYTAHGLRFLQKETAMGRQLFLHLERFVAGRAGHVAVIRGYDEDQVLARRICPQERLTAIRTRIKVCGSAARFRPREGVPLLLGIGSLIPVKRPDLFIEWVAGVTRMGVRVKAVWAGAGPLWEGLEREARSRSLPISFVGHVTGSALQEIIQSASLLLMPSDFEVFPISVIEAAACAVPVICRSYRGVHDVVVDGVTGVVLRNDEPRLAAQTIVDLLANRRRLTSLQNDAIQRYQTHLRDAEQMAQEYRMIYGRLCVGQDG